MHQQKFNFRSIKLTEFKFLYSNFNHTISCSTWNMKQITNNNQQAKQQIIFINYNTDYIFYLMFHVEHKIIYKQKQT